MKKIFLTLFLAFSSSYALDISGAEAGTAKSSFSSSYDLTAMNNFSILTSSQKITFMKNPCFGVKGLHFNTYRGFAFDNGVTKKFKIDGSLGYDDNKGKKYDSLYSFLVQSKVCSSVSQKNYRYKINFEDLQIWD